MVISSIRVGYTLGMKIRVTKFRALLIGVLLSLSAYVILRGTPGVAMQLFAIGMIGVILFCIEEFLFWFGVIDS